MPEIPLADVVINLACNALLSGGQTTCSSELTPLPPLGPPADPFLDSPEDLAWQNRVETRLDTLTSAVDSLINFLRAQGPLPCPLMGAGAAQLVPTPDQNTPQTMMYGGTPPVPSNVTAQQIPNQQMMPPAAYIPVAPPPELRMPPQHQRAQSQADAHRKSRSASTAASTSTLPPQRSSSMPPPEAPVRAATRARSSSASHSLSMWSKPRSEVAPAVTEPLSASQPAPSASSNSQGQGAFGQANGSTSTGQQNGDALQMQQGLPEAQAPPQAALDTGTPIHEPLSKNRLAGLAQRKSLSKAQRQQLEQALASRIAAEQAQGSRRQSGSGSGSSSNSNSSGSGRPAKRARRESSRAPES